MKSPNSDALQAWEHGLQLGEAAFEFASDYEKEKYRTADTRGSIEALGLLMQAELVANIYDGEFVCFGLTLTPGVSQGPEKIDRLLFRDLSNHEMMTKYIDWNESSLNYAGRQYTSIRVLKASRLEKKEEKLELRKKMGRPSIDQQLETIVGKLMKEGRLKGRLRKEQVHLVREAARVKYPDLFPLPTQPSREKILQALKNAELLKKTP
jgi:hypothetical protein